MRVWTSLHYDFATGEFLGGESYEYEGPVAECKGGGKGGDGGAGQVRADEQARQANIRQGTEKINSTFDSEFTPTFYDARRDAFLNYATPQLEDQFKDAQKQLTYSLDRNGTLDSSIRAQKEADLQKLYDTNRRSVADQALGYSTQAKTAVEDGRANLIATLNATGDAEGAANSALARSQALSAPDTYSPLAQLFTSFTSGLGQQAALEKAAALSGGAISPQYTTGLFGSSKNAVQVTP